MPGDRDRYLDLVARSRAFHRPWVYLEATTESYAMYLKRIALPAHEGFFIVYSKTRDLVGVVNMNEIVRGEFRSAYLDYYTLRALCSPWLHEARSGAG